MEKLFSHLNKFSLSTDIHNRIIRTIYFIKYAKYFYAVNFILFLNLVTSIWITYKKLIEYEIIQAVKDMYIGFDWGFQSFVDMFQAFFSHLAYMHLAISLLSFVVFSYIFYMTLSLYKTSHNPYSNSSGRIYD